MYNILLLLKTNLRLLLIRKNILGVILVASVATTMILRASSIFEGTIRGINYRLQVSVIAQEDDPLVQLLLESINDNDNFYVKYIEIPEQGVAHLEEALKARDSSYNTTAYLYIKPNFMERILKGEASEIELYKSQRDQREDLLEVFLVNKIQKFTTLAQEAKGDKTTFFSLLHDSETLKIQHFYVDKVKIKDQFRPGFSFNLNMFVGCLCMLEMVLYNYCNSLVAKDRSEHILERLQLAGVSDGQYFIAKGVTNVILMVVQIVFIFLGIKLFAIPQLPISLAQLIFICVVINIYVAGLSLILQVLIKNSVWAILVTFSVVAVGDLLSGLHYSLDCTPVWMQNFSMLLPQRWFIYVMEELMLGNDKALIYCSIIIIVFVIGLYFVLTRSGSIKARNKV